jgi:hypothetical protein
MRLPSRCATLRLITLATGSILWATAWALPSASHKSFTAEDAVPQVRQAAEASLYVVNADGAGGQWCCPALRQGHRKTQDFWAPGG